MSPTNKDPKPETAPGTKPMPEPTKPDPSVTEERGGKPDDYETKEGKR